MNIKIPIVNWLSNLKKKRINLISKDLRAENQDMIEHAVVGMYIIQDDCFHYVNSKWREIFGYTYEEVVNTLNPLDLIYPEDREFVKQNIERRLSGEFDFIEYEFRALKKQGGVIWVKVLGNRIDYQKRPAIYGTVIDITVQKEKEMAMRKSEERLRVTLESTQIGIWEWDLEQDTWYASPIYHTMLGYDQETGSADRTLWLNRIHPQDRDMVREKIDSVRFKKQDQYTYEGRILHADGSYRWHQVIGHVIEKNAQGEVKRMVGIRKDITDSKLAEEQLKKSEGHLRTLIDTIPDLVWLKDPDGVYLQCNQRFEQFFGASEKEIVGKTDYDFVSKELADFFRQKDKDAISAGKPSINEEEVTFADGHKEILETIKTPIYEEGGRLIGVLGIGRDITERKHTEAALLKNQILLRDSQRVADIGCWEFDIKSEKLYWNEEAYRIYGVEDLNLQPTFEIFIKLVHPDDRWIPAQHYKTTIKTKKFEDFECRIKRGDGSVRLIMVAGDVELNKHGEVSRTFGIIQDLTERKKTEEKLKEREMQLRSLTNTIPDLIWFKSFDGKILQCNRRFEKLFGAFENEIIGKTDYNFISRELADYFREKDNEAIAAKKATINEHEFTFPDGHKEILETIRTPVFGINDEPIGIFCISRDITEKKKNEKELEKHRQHLELLVQERTEELEASLEELHAANEELMIQKEELQNSIDTLNSTRKQLVHSEKMASLGLLAAGIAHEINNPLNFIHGGSVALKIYFDKKLKTEIEEVTPLLDAINEGIKRVSQIVTSLNHYCRKDDESKVKCDMHAIIDNCLTILWNRIKLKVEIRKNYTEKTYTLFGNEGKLHQAILNIIANAEQAIKKEGTIDIVTNVLNNQFVIEIKDSGEGMSQETIEKIFDPFYTTKVPGKGTGLGLSITYNIIQEHNGKITYKSKLGEGTKAIIALPI